ncbi:hypothetical protein FTUN_2647 [Frigoriglobus tundricola]|uniref:Uncharacterized protein n=1 Tax=Frigoriglobus tundricola TaxID=2774151 RepID=A0A6M5YMF7_9BACT|nr:hypothetical protein FTUN_2647 [Frigoriglobus tundricola]
MRTSQPARTSGGSGTAIHAIFERVRHKPCRLSVENQEIELRASWEGAAPANGSET